MDSEKSGNQETMNQTGESAPGFVDSRLKSPKIFLPLLDNGNGQVMSAFMMDHAAAFGGREVFMVSASDSHANRGMNKIANDFLASDCDIWINIDADIRFRREDVDRLLAHAANGVSLVYGIYPKKQEDAPPCVCTFDEIPEPDPGSGLAEVRRAGRGFMLVKRDVLESMKEDNGGPALRYHNHGGIEWDFFPSGVVTGAFSFYGTTKRTPIDLKSPAPVDKDGYPLREWISEDWYFCERARALGFPVMLDSLIALGHVGHKEFRFAKKQLVRMDSDIKNWRDITGWFTDEDAQCYRAIEEHLAKHCFGTGPFQIAEVGCFLGRSTGALLEIFSQSDIPFRIHAIDTFTGTPGEHEEIVRLHGGNLREHFKANLRALGSNGAIEIYQMDSVTAAASFQDGSLDAVFIDGDHAHDSVKADIAAWLPKVRAAGVIAGHDYDYPSVASAVYLAFGDQVKKIGRCWLVYPVR